MPLLTLTTVTLCIAVFGSTSALSCNKKLLSESSQCPFNGSYAIRPEETLAFTIPSSGQKISPGTVCEWELRNTNEDKDSLECKAGSAYYTDTELRFPNNYATFTSSEPSVTFIYRALDEITDRAITIYVEAGKVKEESSTNVALILIGVFSGLLFLVFAIMILRCIIKNCNEVSVGNESDHMTRTELVDKIMRMSPEMPYTEKKNKYKQNDCCICLMPFTKEYKIRILECQHIFHGECLVQYIKRRSSIALRCPMCNITLKGKYKTDEA